ncbi:MAG: hypothetical protein AB8H12_22520 [Lewinella sp.]
MKHLLAISVFLFTTYNFTLSAQWGIGFQDDFTESTCSYDTAITGIFPTTYEVFQTLDNTYDGPIDSNWCPLFVRNGTRRVELDLDTYDFSRPLFVRLRLPEDFASPLQQYAPPPPPRLLPRRRDAYLSGRREYASLWRNG